MKKDEKKLVDLLCGFIDGKLDFKKFASDWDNCYVESNEEFENTMILEEIKDRLDYTTTDFLSEVNKRDGLINIEEFREFLNSNLEIKLLVQKNEVKSK